MQAELALILGTLCGPFPLLKLSALRIRFISLFACNVMAAGLVRFFLSLLVESSSSPSELSSVIGCGLQPKPMEGPIGQT